MTESCVASIDQGTSSTRVLIVNSNGKVLGSHQVEHQQFYPVAGQVEHDPLEIWNSVRICLSKALANVKSDVKIVSIGITNQRETTIVWNKNTGKPYHRAIVWNDTRTSEICDEIAETGGRDKFRDKTGLPVASYFSASKLMYLLKNVPELREDTMKGEALFGTIDTWLMWRLTNGAVHATDVSNASRTMFMNLKTLQWDEEILTELDIPAAMLPTICPSSHRFGTVSTQIGNFAEFRTTDQESFTTDIENFDRYQGVPVSGVLGDQNAALFGQACYQPGESKCTYGTGAFLLFNTGSEILPSQHGLLTTVAYQLGHGADGQTPGAVYALEGSVAYSGSVIQWLRDNLQVIASAKDSEQLAQSVPDNGGVYFVPAFAGLYAPYWRGDARGVIAGLTAYNKKAHIVRAALEASAFQTVEVATAMQADAGQHMRLTSLKVDGGGTQNSLMLQTLADLLGVPVVRPVNVETTAMGAAFVSGLNVGLWKNTDELRALVKVDRTWEPSMCTERKNEMMHGWRKALDRSLRWVDGHSDAKKDHAHTATTAKPHIPALNHLPKQGLPQMSGSTHPSTVKITPPLGLPAEAAAAVKHSSFSMPRAGGKVALGFCVGVAIGTGIVVGIDAMRSHKDKK